MNKKKVFFKKLCILTFLFIIASCFLGMNKKDNDDKKIFKNIFIENIDVSNLTIHEAKKKIEEKHYPKDIKLNYNNKIWIIKAEDIDLNYNVDKTIQKAYEYTREEDLFNNISKMFNLLRKNSYNLSLHATYNETELSKIINSISNDINEIEIEATIQICDSSQIITTDSKEGKKLDRIKLKEIIYDMIYKKDIKQIDLPINIIVPKVTTQDVKSIGCVLGQYSTSFNDSTSRGSNIHVAGKSTSDILLMPGETFSYNNITGPRNWSNGYKRAKVIVGGKYVNGEGGGVCQVSTTIYNAALIAGMDIKEVHNHTFASRYAPKGKDAAVSYGYTDFKFENPYPHPIYIKNIVKKGAITTKIYGCKEDKEKIYIQTKENYEKDKINVDTYRIYLDDNNKAVKKELISKSVYKFK
ncbi:MAG: VanW family protein [Peptostreptococcaceae bacterium]